MQEYKMLGAPSEATIVEKKSEFIAVAAPATTEAQALEVLETVRAKHRTAAHNVYAYVLRQDNRQRYSDDGEPAKTAGLPVLEVLQHAEIADGIIVVTRYFGGTLLGTGGLVRAYTAAAKAALDAAEILTMRPCVRMTLHIDYALFETARRLLSENGVRLQEPEFTDNVTLHGVLLAEKQPPVQTQLDELCRGQARVTFSQQEYLPF